MPALLGILLETAQQHLDEARVQCWRKSRQIDVGLEHVRELLRWRVALERPMPAEQLVKNAAEREDVAPLIGLEALGLLGRHVADSAEYRAGGGATKGRGRVGEIAFRAAVLQKLREAEVEDLHGAAAGQRDVRRFQVAVTDPLLVRGLERIENLPRDAHGFIHGERAGRESLGERLTVDEFQNQERGPAGFGEVVNRGDARVIERRHGLRFAVETGHAIGIGSKRVGKNFDRDLAFQLGVRGLVHLPHAARAEVRGEFVATEAAPQGQRHRPNLTVDWLGKSGDAAKGRGAPLAASSDGRTRPRAQRSSRPTRCSRRPRTRNPSRSTTRRSG